MWVAKTDQTPSCLCITPSMTRIGLRLATWRWRSKTSGLIVTFTCPNSSSRVKKRIFFAVEGA